MRQLLPVILVVCFALNGRSAETPELRLREALAVARTNLAEALRICDKAAAAFPSNAQPLSVRARLLDRSRRYAEAIKDLDAALKLEPKAAQLWQARGEVHFKAGHFKESVADFDRVLEFSPDQAPHHWQRGISLYYAGRFSDGRKQFESHRAVNPNDVENAAWHFLCAARESSVADAREIILPVGKDGRAPMPEIYELYRGKSSVDQVLTAATRAMSEPRQQSAMFFADLYLGLYFEATGNTAKAREYIQRAAHAPGTDHYMGDVARVHLRTLKSSQ